MGRLFQPSRQGRRYSIWWVSYWDRSQRREIRESSGSRSRQVALKLLAQREAEAAARAIPKADPRRRRALAADGSRRRARGPQHHGLTMRRRAVATLGARAIDEETAVGRALAEWRTRVPPVGLLRERNIRTGFFEPGEFHAVVTHLPAALAPVAEFAYLTGWRKGEVLGLTWAQVDFTAGMVRLEPGSTKNDDGRAFPFSALPALGALLTRQRDYTRTVERETGQIVRSVFHRQSQPIKYFRRAWEAACIAAGFVRVDPTTTTPRASKLFHDFRRTAVRNLERAGVSRSVAMKLTGHKT